MITEFSQQLTQLLASNKHGKGLTVALSGGVDSMVLLHLSQRYCAQQQLPLSAVHIHHGLSEYADDWQQFCAQQCEALEVPFKSKRVELGSTRRKGIEAVAREARYQALNELAPKGDAILLGQHANDQIETFLLRLKRGAGLSGLGAMAQQRLVGTVQAPRLLLRPLLRFEREQIEAYSAENDIAHIEDDSNQDEHFDRNFLRHQIVAPLQTRFKGFAHKVLQTTMLLQRQQSLLDEYVREDIEPLLAQDSSLHLAPLAMLSKVRVEHIIRYWLQLHHLEMPSEKQLDNLITQLISAGDDAQLSAELKTHQQQKRIIRRYQDFAYVCEERSAAQEQVLEHWQLPVVLTDETQLVANAGKGVRPPHASERVSVRFGVLNARIQPQFKPYSNKLSHWLKELKVPPWQRRHIPLVYYNEELVAVVGYFYNVNYEQEQGIQWQLTHTSK